MSFDGIVVKSLVAELREKLIDTKIDKVYQPEKDEICLKIRSKEGAHKLILSASSVHLLGTFVTLSTTISLLS